MILSVIVRVPLSSDEIWERDLIPIFEANSSCERLSLSRICFNLKLIIPPPKSNITLK